MGLFKDSSYDMDHVPRPFDVQVPGTDISRIKWTPYPRPKGSRRAELDVFFNEQLNLAEICDDINHLLTSDGQTITVNYELWQMAEHAGERLCQWHDRLPVSLDLNGGPPHFINLRYGTPDFVVTRVLT